jgi:S-DNA-T family DNA segregation ATPase FtsK/SpoIIIE
MAAKRKSASRKKASVARRPPRKPVSKAEALPAYAWHEGIAIALGGIAILYFLALVSYTPRDLPSWVPWSSTSGIKETVSNFIGPAGALLAGCSYFLFGAACYLIPGVLVWWAIMTLLGNRVFQPRNFIALFALLVSATCLIEYQDIFFQAWPTLYNLPSSAGGLFGYAIGQKLFASIVGTVGAFIVAAIAYAVAMIVITGLHPFRFALLVRERSLEWLEDRRAARELALSFEEELTPVSSRRSKRKQSLEEEFGDEDEAATVSKRSKRRKKSEEIEARHETIETVEEMELPLAEPNPEPKIIDSSVRRKEASEGGDAPDPALALFRRKKKPEGGIGPDQGLISSNGEFDDYELPSLALLEAANPDDAVPTDHGALLDVQRTIVDTLNTFGVEVSPGDITKGPTITRYEIYPSPGLRVNRITSLEADIARATKAERINIIAPIPGKDTVGIEIANSDKVLVPLRELFEDDAFNKTKAHIPLALGKDVYGRTIVGDLARMPHLLVAGATGSGKSVCINSIIASLLYRFTPDELRFIMIDPKVVEMQMYNSLPHLVVPVVTDPKKVLLALRWVVNEMERRYAMFAKLNCRNFDSFNGRKPAEEKAAAKAADKATAAANAKAKASGGSKTRATTPAQPPVSSAALVLDDEDDNNGEFSVELPTDDVMADALVPPFDADDDSGLEDNDLAMAGSSAAFTAHPVNINESAGQGFDAVSGATPGFQPDDEPELTAAERVSTPVDPDEDNVPDTLPYIVVIIDELADLMQTAPADVETAIARIAQKARAAGIHLIVATQTPRADVVTGIIKANIPSRIAFQVSGKIDSRVILDAPGADRLVGKGDMLFLPPGSAQLVRAQGAMISDEEITEVVEFCAKQGEPNYEPDIQETLEGNGTDGEDDVSDEDEEILEKCLEVIAQEKRASTSFLQRRLRLGYTRAARMMDILEQRGIIGPGDGAKPREILVDLSQEFG